MLVQPDYLAMPQYTLRCLRLLLISYKPKISTIGLSAFFWIFLFYSHRWSKAPYVTSPDYILYGHKGLGHNSNVNFSSDYDLHQVNNIFCTSVWPHHTYFLQCQFIWIKNKTSVIFNLFWFNLLQLCNLLVLRTTNKLNDLSTESSSCYCIKI